MSAYPIASVCFIACHAGPADHFAVFAQELIREGVSVEVRATGPAVQKFKDRQIAVIEFTMPLDLEAEALQFAKSCTHATAVMTDVGHALSSAIHTALSMEARSVLRIAYYDNPEPYVPGGYSVVASKAMQAAQRVVFANANLAQSLLMQGPDLPIDLPSQERVGIGYYPVAQADQIAARRGNEKEGLRASFLAKHGIADQQQPLLVYFGGNNFAYFERAFPAFLSYLSEAILKHDLSNQVIVLQQHPGAKAANLDGSEFETWKHSNQCNPYAPTFIISSETTSEMQVVADAALYYQTSMGPLFALSGIPMVQVGHERYEDIIVKNQLCKTALSGPELAEAFSSVKPVEVTAELRSAIFNNLGIKDEWVTLLKQAIVP